MTVSSLSFLFVPAVRFIWTLILTVFSASSHSHKKDFSSSEHDLDYHKDEGIEEFQKKREKTE